MEEIIDPKFEIVGLYPLYGIIGAKLVMSGHIYLIDWDLDIRGFMIHCHAKPEQDNPKRQNTAYAPGGKNWDYEEKKIVVYPIVSTIRGKWLEKVKEVLIKAGQEKFKKFVFPENFPKSYFAYIESRKEKEKVELKEDRKEIPRPKKPYKYKLEKNKMR